MNLFLWLACAAFAQGDLPQPAAVPMELPREERARLAKRRVEIVKDRKRLQDDIDGQRRRCRHVEVGNAADTVLCEKWSGRLGHEDDDYSAELVAFQKSLDAAQAAVHRAGIFDCAVAQACRQADSIGTEGRALSRQLREDFRRVLAELRDVPPSGEADADKEFTGGPDHIAKDKAGERQVVVRVSVRRREKNGEVHLDVQSSITGNGVPEQASQNVIILDASGTVISKDVSGAAEACLKAERSQ